jgi:hypothetical protein
MLNRYVADGFWDGICHVDVDPPGDGTAPPLDTPAPTGGDDANSQLESLRSELAAKQKALDNARQIERRYKSLEAIVGDTNPEKLQELRDAEQRLKQEQAERERLIIEAKNQVTSEYKSHIDELQKLNTKLASEQQQVALTFELFKEFNQAEGDGTKFDGFVTLSQGLFHRTDSGEIQVKDAKGRIVTTKDEDSTLRPATPREFMKLLIAGKLDNDYDIPNADFLKMSFAPYNKAMGAGLPSGNGAPMPKDLSSLSQAQLGSLIFGG